VPPGEYTAAASEATSKPALPLRAWPRAARALAGALVAVSRASLPVVAVAAFAQLRPELLEPPVLIPVLGVFALLPAAAALALAARFASSVEITGSDLVIRGRTRRVEVPLARIARVEPWRVPLPGVGFGLRLASGRRLLVGLEGRDPAPVLAALAAAGVPAAGDAVRRPAFAFAHARASDSGGRLRTRLFKFGIFSLAPTAVMFNAHQHIAYGGSLGQYYLEGLRPYLATFGFYWVTIVLYLLLYAGLWRALAEAAAFLAALAAPSRAARVRRAVERIALAAYYAGVPALVAARFLA
jgi:apolipoprotein N-acyltransferase